MLDLSRAVTWREGDRHQVGRVAIVRYTPTLTGHCQRNFDDGLGKAILVRHSHTGELEWVAKSELENYPSTEIPTP